MANVLARLDNKEYPVLSTNTAKIEEFKDKGYDIYTANGVTKLEEDNLKTLTFNEHLTLQAEAVAVVQAEYDAYKVAHP